MIKKSPKKNAGIAIGISLLLFIIGVSIAPDDASTITQPDNQQEILITLTDSDKELLNKSYKDFDVSQRTQFEEIIAKYDALQDSGIKQAIKPDLDRLLEERDLQVAIWKEEEAKKAEEAALLEAKKYDTGITYEQLARTPDTYNGQYVKFTGTVIQVIEGTTETNLRVAVNDDYDRVIFVGYDPSITAIRMLEDDTVTIKGRSIGLYTYQSTLGGNISIPGVYVYEISLND